MTESADEYARAGANAAERYARFARESIDEQVTMLRSIAPPHVVSKPAIAAGSMWTGVSMVDAALHVLSVACDAAFASQVMKNAEELGVGVPPDIAERAAARWHGEL